MYRIVFILVWVICFACSATAQDTKPAKLFPQVPENTEIQTFAGNWKMDMVDTIDGEKITKFITLKPPYRHACEKPKDKLGSSCRFLKDKNTNWKPVVASAYNDYPSGLQISGASMTFHHSSGTMGHWGSKSTVNFSGNRGQGHWETKDRSNKKGTVAWTRVLPKITKVEFYNVNSIATDDPSNVVSYGTNGRVHGVYKHEHWHAEYWPRPEFIVNIFGDNLWGFHIFDVKDGVNLTANGCAQIGEGALHGNMNAIGLQCSVKIWPNVTNGLKTLRLDNLDIPFVLDVKDLPDTPPEDIDEDIMVKITDLIVDKTPYRTRKTNLANQQKEVQEKLQDRKEAIAYRKKRFDAEFARFQQTVLSLNKKIKPFRAAFQNTSPADAAAYRKAKDQLWVEQQDYNRRYKLANDRVNDTVLAYDKAESDFKQAFAIYSNVSDQNLEADLGTERELVQVSLAPAFLAKTHDRHGALHDLDIALTEAEQATARADLEREKARLEMQFASDMVTLASERLETNIYASYTSQALVEAGLQIRDAIKNAKNGPAAFTLWAGVRLTENVLKPPKIYEPDYKLREGYAPYQEVVKGYHLSDGKLLETATGYATKKAVKYAIDKKVKEISKDYFQKQMTEIMTKRLGMPIKSPDVSSLKKMFAEQNVLFEEVEKQLKDKSFRSGTKNFTAAWGKDIIQEQVKGVLVEETKRYLAEFFEGQAWRSYIETEQDFAYAVRVFRMNGNIYWKNRDILYSLRGLKKTLTDIQYDADTGFQFERNDKFKLKAGEEIWLFFTGDDASPETGVDTSANERLISVFLEDVKLKRVQNSNRFLITQKAYDDLATSKKEEFTLKIQYQ